MKDKMNVYVVERREVESGTYPFEVNKERISFVLLHKDKLPNLKVNDIVVCRNCSLGNTDLVVLVTRVDRSDIGMPSLNYYGRVYGCILYDEPIKPAKSQPDCKSNEQIKKSSVKEYLDNTDEEICFNMKTNATFKPGTFALVGNNEIVLVDINGNIRKMIFVGNKVTFINGKIIKEIQEWRVE